MKCRVFIFKLYLFTILLVKLNTANAEVQEENEPEIEEERINVGITFTKTTGNDKLKEKFRLCVSSLLKYATVDINFYIIGDDESQYVAKQILSRVKNRKIKYRFVSLDADDLAKRMHALVAKMQSHFSHSPSSYYGDSLFFLSIGLYRVFDQKIGKIILLDADLKFKEDIRLLHDLFNKFNESNLIGIARDGQPVYRHLFWQYRNENPNTRVGGPPPNGLTGFNSGVLLLDLDKMRKSKIYESLLTPEAVDRLTNKYHFRGHLGDQDFFSLIGMEHEELFHVLPCTWNRQLCTWWGEHGYGDVLEQYYKCAGKINIYHGNCDTAIPKDEDDVEYDNMWVKDAMKQKNQRNVRIDL
jgi:lipopolysaccharide biosynthesis glycosyltransferase